MPLSPQPLGGLCDHSWATRTGSRGAPGATRRSPARFSWTAGVPSLSLERQAATALLSSPLACPRCPRLHLSLRLTPSQNPRTLGDISGAPPQNSGPVLCTLPSPEAGRHYFRRPSSWTPDTEDGSGRVLSGPAQAAPDPRGRRPGGQTQAPGATLVLVSRAPRLQLLTVEARPEECPGGPETRTLSLAAEGVALIPGQETKIQQDI